MSQQVPKKYEKNIITDLPRFIEVGGHHASVPSWINHEIFPGLNFRVDGADVRKFVGAPHAVPHTHDDNEIYLSPTLNRGDVIIEVQMDDEKFAVESPFAVFIPAGVKHCFTVLKCDSQNIVFGIHTASG
ncbi:hypothetical protein ACFLYF_03055 [Chloroflexota bacterium]